MNRIASAILAAASLIAAPAFGQDAIKIGVTQPLTGAFAASGNYVTQGARIAEEQINAAGGVLGRKIQLVVEDNKSNPTEAVATAEKLIGKDKVPGDDGRLELYADARGHAEADGIRRADAGETSSSAKITTSGKSLDFPHQPDLGDGSEAFAGNVKALGIRKADFLATNNDFRPGASKEFSEMLKAQGVQIGVVETMDPKATDFSAQLAKNQGLGQRHAVRHHGGRADHPGPQAGEGAAGEAAHHHHRRLHSPDQLIQQAGEAANGSLHLVFFTPWFQKR